MGGMIGGCVLFLRFSDSWRQFPWGMAACCVAYYGALKRLYWYCSHMAIGWPSMYTMNEIYCKNKTLRWSNRIESFVKLVELDQFHGHEVNHEHVKQRTLYTKISRGSDPKYNFKLGFNSRAY